MNIRFDCTKEEAAIINAIADRADRDVFGAHGVSQTKMDTMMDITATHMNGCRLKLEALRDAPAFDFAHDVAGIRRHIDRHTGELKDCFLPRYAA